MRSEEGVGGKYTCAECKDRVYRDQFLIEATDPLTGKVDPGYDWQGGLHGRCYKCVRGLGPNKTKDAFTDSKHKSEQELVRIFKRLCTQRHGQCKDIKSRDAQRLRCKYFDQLMADIGSENPTMTKPKVRQLCVETIKAMCAACVDSHNPDKLKMIMREYVAIKNQEAENPDAGIVIPGGPTWGEQTQWLHAIGKGTSRFFLCRRKDCSPQGSFFGPNTDWAHTAEAGGWHFACPICGHWYKPGALNQHTIPAHFVFYFEQSGRLLLAAWPASAEEDTIKKNQQSLAEEDVEEWESLPKDELMAKVTKFVRDSSVPIVFQPMQLTTEIKAYFDDENRKRSKKKPWSYKHLETGFSGAFFKWTEDSPVLSAEDTKRFLAGLKVLTDRS